MCGHSVFFSMKWSPTDECLIQVDFYFSRTDDWLVNTLYTRCEWLQVWRSGNTSVSMNIVTPLQAQLVSDCVTVFGQVNHLGAELGTHAYSRVLTTLENMEISGNLLILEKSGNLKFTQGIYMILSLGHRVVCIIVSNSSVNWLSDTVTGVDRASHHVPSIKYSVILQESCRTDC